jgi:hypothetical protein
MSLKPDCHIESRGMRRAGQVVSMGEKRSSYSVFVGKPEGRRALGCRDNIKIDPRRSRK